MKRILIKLIKFYRKRISPMTPPRCKYIPTCSQYAIEAIENSEFKKFQLAILKNKGEVVIIIKNSFEGERLSIQRIYQKGFSTKGSNRGLGLTNVKEIIDRNPNVNLETLIENNEFTQVVKIKD